MAGIYIPNMEMPSQTESCIFYQEAPFRLPYCAINKVCQGIENCPLVSVPPHGRLIDADAFLALINDSTILPDFLKCIINPLIRGEPTILPAEEGE